MSVRCVSRTIKRFGAKTVRHTHLTDFYFINHL